MDETKTWSAEEWEKFKADCLKEFPGLKFTRLTFQTDEEADKYFDEIREERKRRGEQVVIDLVEEARRETNPDRAEAKDKAGQAAATAQATAEEVDLGDGDDCVIWQIRRERKMRGEPFYSEQEVIDLVEEAKREAPDGR